MSIWRSMVIFWFGIVLILIALFPFNSASAEWVQLDELSIDYKNFAVLNPRARQMLIYPEPPKEGLNLNVNTTFFGYVYWNSTVESVTTQYQYRGIGLETRLGVNLHKSVRAGLYHHSEHTLDRGHSSIVPFPVTDAIEVRLFLYQGKQERRSLF